MCIRKRKKKDSLRCFLGTTAHCVIWAYLWLRRQVLLNVGPTNWRSGHPLRGVFNEEKMNVPARTTFAGGENISDIGYLHKSGSSKTAVSFKLLRLINRATVKIHSLGGHLKVFHWWYSLHSFPGTLLALEFKTFALHKLQYLLLLYYCFELISIWTCYYGVVNLFKAAVRNLVVAMELFSK